ncbi:hypothetical protein CBR_g21016 [Chara braunii]|uniref:Uncharacterized protein n=1 Tax=Chara braunii TaxID=69332 RepID=A0A388L0L1_CHABU|nr:hypothetical protein CBR_g21016 [Chara braunii]|eukprot:GBG75772.1 hypothetical protein CBR_g21016 [Chara braunii]
MTRSARTEGKLVQRTAEIKVERTSREMASNRDLQQAADNWLVVLQDGRRRLQEAVLRLSSAARDWSGVDWGATSLTGWLEEMLQRMLGVLGELEKGPDPRWEHLLDWQLVDELMCCCYELYEEGNDLCVEYAARSTGEPTERPSTVRPLHLLSNLARAGILTSIIPTTHTAAATTLPAQTEIEMSASATQVTIPIISMALTTVASATVTNTSQKSTSSVTMPSAAQLLTTTTSMTAVTTTSTITTAPITMTSATQLLTTTAPSTMSKTTDTPTTPLAATTAILSVICTPSTLTLGGVSWKALEFLLRLKGGQGVMLANPTALPDYLRALCTQQGRVLIGGRGEGGLSHELFPWDSGGERVAREGCCEEGLG